MQVAERQSRAVRLGWAWLVLLTVSLGAWAALPAPREAAAQDGAAAGAGGQAAGGAAGEKPKEPDNFLVFFYKSMGWLYLLIFGGISFCFVALTIMAILGVRRESICPSALVEAFEQHLNEKKYQEAYELAKADESFLGQVLSAGLAKLSAGYPQAIEAMQEVGEEENMKLDHRLSYIGLIGTISPMVGLFGTVDGMIRSFSVIANSPSTPKPSELANGISTALMTTIVGLAIAIPALIAYNLLRNRVARLVLEVGIVSEGLMSRFENVGGQKK